MVLHIVRGDDLLRTLERSGLPGRTMRWADPLCEGPLRRWPDAASRRAERAAWLAARYGGTVEQHGELLASDDAALEAAVTEDEVVLWCKDDVCDQTVLVFWLNHLAARGPGCASLVALGPQAVQHGFVGPVQSREVEWRALYETRRPVTAAELEAGRAAWAALTAGDPDPIEALAREDTGPLPFVPAALRRWLAELPSVRNGLSLTESLALQAVAAGADRPRHVFAVVQRFEERPWMGDRMFYARLRQLGRGPCPLVTAVGRRMPSGGDPEFEAVTLSLTPEGRAVLDGRADWFRLACPNRWHGSLLLEGPEPAFRWDEVAQRVRRRSR
jgi:hypothetical protein